MNSPVLKYQPRKVGYGRRSFINDGERYRRPGPGPVWSLCDGDVHLAPARVNGPVTPLRSEPRIHGRAGIYPDRSRRILRGAVAHSNTVRCPNMPECPSIFPKRGVFIGGEPENRRGGAGHVSDPATATGPGLDPSPVDPSVSSFRYCADDLAEALSCDIPMILAGPAVVYPRSYRWVVGYKQIPMLPETASALSPTASLPAGRSPVVSRHTDMPSHGVFPHPNGGELESWETSCQRPIRQAICEQQNLGHITRVNVALIWVPPRVEKLSSLAPDRHGQILAPEGVPGRRVRAQTGPPRAV